MNRKEIDKVMGLAYQTIRICKLIGKGWVSPSEIAKRVGCTKSLAQYYVRRLK